MVHVMILIYDSLNVQTTQNKTQTTCQDVKIVNKKNSELVSGSQLVNTEVEPGIYPVNTGGKPGIYLVIAKYHNYLLFLSQWRWCFAAEHRITCYYLSPKLI